jgi:hypothetical protein
LDVLVDLLEDLIDVLGENRGWQKKGRNDGRDDDGSLHSTSVANGEEKLPPTGGVDKAQPLIRDEDLQDGVGPIALSGCACRHGHRNAIPQADRGFNSIQVHFVPLANERVQFPQNIFKCWWVKQRHLFINEGVMDLHKKFVVAQAYLYRVVDYPNRGSNRHHGVEFLDVFWIETDTPMTNAHADAKRSSLIGAVDEVARNSESEREVPERVVGISSWYHRWKILAIFRVFLPDALRGIPRGIDLFGDNFCGALGGPPIVVPDAHGKCVYGLFTWWKIVET